MMSAASEGAERVAEILREIFALSEMHGPNDSKSAALDDSIKLYDARHANEVSGICAAERETGER
jgi:hypothetical protein